MELLKAISATDGDPLLVMARQMLDSSRRTTMIALLLELQTINPRRGKTNDEKNLCHDAIGGQCGVGDAQSGR
jgi:hypothetical protein